MHDEPINNQLQGRWQLKGARAIIAALQDHEAQASCESLARYRAAPA